jgi:hypothetical protein
MNQPVRRETDAGRNQYESIGRDKVILWKTFILSSDDLFPDINPRRMAVETRDFPPNPQASTGLACPRCAVVRVKTRNRRHDGLQNAAKNERPVRGDIRTGQAIWAHGVDGRSRRI